MSSPLLSICLITYNHEKYIEETLAGISIQKVDFPIELIIADDFSTDKTRDIIRKFCESFPHTVKLIFQEKNVGPGDNFRDLMLYPNSKYIAYIEGDDYWIDPLKLQKQVDYLEKNEKYYGVSHNVKHYFENWNSAYAIRNNSNYKLKQGFHGTHNGERLPGIISLKEIHCGWPIASCSILFRRKVLDNYPDFFWKSTLGDQFLYSLINKCGSIYYMSDIMSVYRIHKGGINNREKEGAEFYKNRLESLKVLYDFYEKRETSVFKPIISMCHFQIAIFSKSRSERLSNLFKGVITEPKSILKKPRLILSVLFKTLLIRRHYTST